MLGGIIGGLLFILLAVLAFILLKDESSKTSYEVPCQLYSGRTVTVKVICSSLFARLLKRVTGDIWSVTIGRRIYVAGPYLVMHALRHELEHVRQWEQSGYLVFPFEYLVELLRAGFMGNFFERQARNASGQSHGRR